MDRRRTTRAHAHPYTLTPRPILALVSIKPLRTKGLGSFPPSLATACTPYYEHLGASNIVHTPLLDVRPCRPKPGYTRCHCVSSCTNHLEAGARSILTSWC